MEPKRYKIHIVEDSKIIAEILKKIISSIPEIDAKYFLYGETMLEEFNLGAPDMVFLDYYLYKNRGTLVKGKSLMNGDVVFNEIKKMAPNTPVVLLTGMNDKQKLEELKTLGFCCVIHKNEDDIYDSVIDCVNKFLLNKV